MSPPLSAFSYYKQQKEGVFYKKFLSVIFTLIIISVLCVSAYAGDERIAKKTGNLTFSGTTANCSACVFEADSNITLNMTLYHDSSVVGTWSTTGKNYVSLDKTCSVDAGEEYM